MKLSLIQLQTAPTPSENLPRIQGLLRRAKAEGAELCVLPEMCCCPYENSAFVRYAMAADAPFLQALAAEAKALGIYLVAGSVPEADGGRIYNTSFVYDPAGQCIARHRKVHLFDIQVEGGQQFRESDTFTAGDSLTLFETPWGKCGVMICYDIRFPEWARLLALAGARLVLAPAAFNHTTGPAHWELSFRARALDNQIFLAGCAPAPDPAASYHAWGHSLVTDPWGGVVASMGTAEGILTVELDMGYLEKIRRELPLLQHRRTDLYTVEAAGKEKTE